MPLRARVLKRRKLLPHQRRMFQYGIVTQNPAWICEMRLGKTLVTIRWAKRLQLRTIVVVAPVTVLETWEEELEREGEEYLTAYGLMPSKRIEAFFRAFKSKGRKWLLISYESVVGRRTKRDWFSGEKIRIPFGDLDTDVIGMLAWDAVILDESTKIKNPTSTVSKFFCKFFREAKHRAILTGLPNPEGDLDLYQQYKFLNGEFCEYPDYWLYRNGLFRKGQGYYRYHWNHKPGARSRIKSEVRRISFMLNRRQAGIKDKIVYQSRYVDMTPRQRKLYKEIEKTYAATLKSGELKKTKWVLTQKLWLQRAAGGHDPDEGVVSRAKAREVLNLLKGELAGQKAIVWFKFRSELALVAQTLKKAGISYVSIDPQDDLPTRKRKLREFRAETRVLLATEKIAKFGVDASVCNTAIYYSNEWSCEDRMQSEVRIIHPLKGEPLLVIDLITRNTIDREVVEAVRKKRLNGRVFMSHINAAILGRN